MGRPATDSPYIGEVALMEGDDQPDAAEALARSQGLHPLGEWGCYRSPGHEGPDDDYPVTERTGQGLSLTRVYRK